MNNDRFNSMRIQGINTFDATATAADIINGKIAYANGEKIIGRLIPESGGSGDSGYNIYIQNSEPSSKDGVWIKSTTGNSNSVYFSQNMTAKGEIIESSNFSYLNTSNQIYAQIIVGNYLYDFNNARPCKYNLKTKALAGNINYPTNLGTWQAFYYKGNIYTVTGPKGAIYIYYIDSDSSKLLWDGNYHIGSDPYYAFCAMYNGAIYEYGRGYYTAGYFKPWKIDLDTLENYQIPNLGNLAASSTRTDVSFTQIGEYIYTFQYYNLSTAYTSFSRSRLGTSESKKLTTPPAFGAIYGAGNFVYLFPHGLNNTTYYIYDISTNVWEPKKTLIPFSLNYGDVEGSGYGTGASRQCLQPLAYDEATGLLYLRTNNYPVTAFQFENSPLAQNLSNGTVVLTENFSGKPVLMKDNSNLTIGISDVSIVQAGELNHKYLAFYGDGEKWILSLEKSQ